MTISVAVTIQRPTVVHVDAAAACLPHPIPYYPTYSTVATPTVSIQLNTYKWERNGAPFPLHHPQSPQYTVFNYIVMSRDRLSFYTFL